jgi:ferredoxin
MMAWLRDTVLRLFPHPTGTGLRRIGDPGPDSPVLVTCNYALTVRRLERVLRGRDVWLLVANSRGINVWCAATGGHFTHHDVIAAIRTSRLADEVKHRRLLLPQLAATGIQPQLIEAATGFRGRWGPARLEALPGYLARGHGVRRDERKMTFPMWERLEMAIMWALPLALIAIVTLWLAVGLRVALVTAAATLAAVFGLFVTLPRVPLAGAIKWLGYGAAAALAAAAAGAVLWLSGGATTSAYVTVAGAQVMAMLILSADLAGTTPWYPGTINSLGNRFDIELAETKCTGAAECVKVCPSEVLVMDGKRHKVRIDQPEACIRCGACIVQCPDDALQFRFPDGHVVGPEVVRTTHVNMLGRRAHD